MLSLIRTVTSLSSESDILMPELAARLTEAITASMDYRFVGLLTPSSHSGEELVLSGWNGSEWLGKEADPHIGLGRPLHVRLAHPWFAHIERNRSVPLEGVSDAHLADFLGCHASDVRRMKEYLRLTSVHAVKLVTRRRLVGVLVIGYGAPVGPGYAADTELLEQLAGYIAVAVDSRLLIEENRRMSRRLKESNAKLVALDDARDDFISMASHQLRTPLTSVKGYTSMVLEGDAGKLTASQRKLLNQSFVSAQRMVYLIADLLNVSRLKTGKFVMDPTSVDLAQMVEEEVEQLKETAAGHSLKLSYARPKKFPEVRLDETKTRQVIMNFIDNAIYYTPAKGRIEVRLTETPTTIEFRVQDNGMGVPKREQPHLFTKFYRAGNARKARPDGTGLGLFMAKKVIVAQGGSIIFESEEGKGSTFGFIFSKHKISAKTTEKA